MSTITFYGKPRCISNNKQKKMLREVGLEVDDRDILSENWNSDSLKLFFGSLPIEQWFNRNAPDVKSGKIKPDSFSEQEALDAMTSDPLLIRRPLIQTPRNYHCGFDLAKICEEYGLHSGINQPADIESCAHTSH